MDPETLIASYEAREPLYTEGDYLRRFAEIRQARVLSVSGSMIRKAPDWMVALLASGRVNDTEYFRLAGMLGVDSAGLIYSEPAPGRGLAVRLQVVWRTLTRAVAALRRA